MHIRDRSWEPIGDDRYGGQATVFQCTYEGRQVAVKVPYLYLVNLDNILAVSSSPTPALYLSQRADFRDSAERQFPGNTSSIRTFSRCLV